MSEINIVVDLNGAGNTLKTTIGDLEKFQALLLQIKANKDALASAEQLTNVKKLTAELKKAELQVSALQEKERQRAENAKKKAAEEQGAYKQLSLKYREALQLAKDMAAQETILGQARSKETNAAIAEAKKLNDQLKAIDYSMGNYGRNVGNYNEKLTVLSKSLRGFGALGGILSRAIGIDPEVMQGISEAGRALRDIKHVHEAENLVSKEGAVAKTEEAAAQEALNVAELGGVGIIPLIAAGTAALVAAVATYILRKKEQKEIEDYVNKSFDGTIQKSVEARNEYNEHIVKLHELDNEYKVTTGELNKFQASLDNLAFKNKVTMDEIAKDTVSKIGETMTSWKTFFGLGFLAAGDMTKAYEEALQKIKKVEMQSQEERYKLWDDWYKEMQDMLDKNALGAIEHRKKMLDIEGRLNRENEIALAKEREKVELEQARRKGENLTPIEEKFREEIAEINKKWDEKAQADRYKTWQTTQKEKEERDKIELAQLEEKEKEKQEKLKQLQKEEEDNNKDTISRLVKDSQSGNEKLANASLDMLKRLAQQNTKLGEMAADALVEAEKEAHKKRIENLKQQGDEVFSLLTQQAEQKTSLAKQEVQWQQKLVDVQLKLAEAGKENNLGEALRQKAELERQALEHQKKLERLKKLETYFNLLAKYAETEPDSAARKAFVQVAAAEILSKAFAAKGGIGEDIQETTQVLPSGSLSRSHGAGKDMHVVMSKKEGILTEAEIDALGGKKGFYLLKDLLKNPIKDDLIQRQESSFSKVIPFYAPNNELLKEVRSLNEKFDSIPKIVESVDGLGNVMTETRTKGLVKKVISKPRQI